MLKLFKAFLAFASIFFFSMVFCCVKSVHPNGNYPDSFIYRVVFKSPFNLSQWENATPIISNLIIIGLAVFFFIGNMLSNPKLTFYLSLTTWLTLLPLAFILSFLNFGELLYPQTLIATPISCIPVCLAVSGITLENYRDYKKSKKEN
jgi:hypothetical protein